MVRLGEQIHPHSQSVCPMLATNETLEVLPNSGRVGGRSQIACLNFNISHGIVFLVHHALCQKSTGHCGRNNNYYKNNIIFVTMLLMCLAWAIVLVTFHFGRASQ